MRSTRAVLLLASSLPLLHCGSPSPPMPGQTGAFAVVHSRFAAAFPGRDLSEPDVRSWTADCPGTRESAVVLGGTCYSGQFYGGDAVEVAWRGSFGESAYSHELMHYFMDRFGGGSDPGHTQARFWDLVNQTD